MQRAGKMLEATAQKKGLEPTASQVKLRSLGFILRPRRRVLAEKQHAQIFNFRS